MPEKLVLASPDTKFSNSGVYSPSSIATSASLSVISSALTASSSVLIAISSLFSSRYVNWPVSGAWIISCKLFAKTRLFVNNAIKLCV